MAPGWSGQLLAVLYLVWLLMYNFMDGIDGLAGLETLTVCWAPCCWPGWWCRRLPFGRRCCFWRRR
ncbi:MAG: hypothetical protein U5J62_07995 [Desulfurivibrio sp.]|nr:hypothetical protein [Desulfurivibrio sp.]